MADQIDLFLRDLNENQVFQMVLDKKVFPGIPKLDLYRKGLTDKDWILRTGLREGYLLALRKLNIKIPNDRLTDTTQDSGSSSEYNIS